MAFSIDNLLKKQTPPDASAFTNTNEENRDKTGNAQNSNLSSYPWSTDAGRGVADNVLITDRSISGSGAALIPPQLPTQQLPTLADLQLLFGGGGPKAHYRRNRRSGADRKPRQAYSSKQLEKLEDEFKKDKYLSVSKRVELSKSLSLSETQIKTWFQNRRTKWKKQVTASLRQLYRHGFYSQYAAANSTSGCFLPMIQPPTGFFDSMESQPSTSAGLGMHPNNPWMTHGNLFMPFPTGPTLNTAAVGQGNDASTCGRSSSVESSCSSEAESIETQK